MDADPRPAGPPRPAARHRLSRQHLAALAAGGGSADTTGELLAVELSWRKVMFRAVLDAAQARPEAAGPLPPVEQAWELLARAERAVPSEVERLLLHPHVGTWAGYTLRRLRGSAGSTTPLWVDVGYLHAVAAAAAIRAGLGFSTRVPVRNGFAIFPTLGGARLPTDAPWDHAQVAGSLDRLSVTGAGGSVQIGLPAPDADRGWVGLRRLHAEAAGQVLSIGLDDLDPYRNLRTPTPPQPLTAPEVQRWADLLSRAWQVIVRSCPHRAPPLARGLLSVVPRPAAERFRTMSASAGDAFGSAIMSEPDGAIELAVTLVHEFQHIQLGGLLHLVALHEGEPPERLYAPWRDDPRPLGGLLQGVYAFVGIVDFWRAFRRDATGPPGQQAHFEFARWRQPVWSTLHRLRDLPQLTRVGRELVAGLTATVRPWLAEPVPAGLASAAEAAVVDHRALWRLHHLRPDPETVAGLAEAWSAGRAASAGPVPAPLVEPDPSARWLDTRAVLIRWRLRDPAGFAQLHRDPTTAAGQVSGATAADVSYVAGELDRAGQLYQAELAADPDRPSAWAGLGLVATATRPGPAAGALLDRPELVRAVHRATRAAGGTVDPLELAGWLGPGPPTGPAG